MEQADALAYDDRYKKWWYKGLPILPTPFRYVETPSSTFSAP
ncbi:hypothetical protein [Gemmiger formicilis]|nr:hypothetical protein [Gemmiger formicilis]